jgi:hypothetical protein
MNQEIKNYFLNFHRLNKRWIFAASLTLVILGLFFYSGQASAQEAMSCGFGDLACYIGNAVFSILIKIVVLVVFAIPLLISALIVGIVGLILGWVISPDFISLKFTQNPFVNIGLSITKGFANMAFIFFLIIIALATILRIEEYKAKKTLTTLIIVALLVNFSPVFCGIIIDFTNTIMDFFLSHVAGINGFTTFIMNAAKGIWDVIWSSGLDLWANISAAMVVIVSLIFNIFCAYIFILFIALFIMRYIMLWILVIISPIAFVSYILPMTRNGGSILNWKEWWHQLVQWSIIGIIAGFFLYLGFTMIGLMTADIGNTSTTGWGTVTHPDELGLGLMNDILPYLIPLVLLLIAYKETKRTSAMFAREIIQTTEKIGKAAVTTTAMVAMTAATAGAGAAVGAAKGAPGAIGAFQRRMDKYATEHEETTGGKMAGWMSRRAGSLRGKDVEGYIDTGTWVGRRREDVGNLIGGARGVKAGVEERVGEWTERQKDKHPDIAATVGWMRKQAEKGFNTAILGKGKKEVEGRPLNKGERNQEAVNGKKYRYDEITTTEKKQQPITPEDKRAGKVKLPNGQEKKIAGSDLSRDYVEYEEEVKDWKKTNQELTDKELKSEHLIEKREVATLGLAPIFKNAMKTIGKGFDEAIEDQMNKMFNVVSLKLERELEKVDELIAKAAAGGEITNEDVSDMDWARKIKEGGGEIDEEKLRKRKAVLEKKKGKEIKQGGTKLQIPKVSDGGKIFSDIGKIFRKKPKTPKKDESQPPPPPPPPPPTGPGPDETGEGGSSGGVSSDETG